MQINCRLGSEEALGFPAQQAFPLNVDHALVVLLGQQSRSSGGGHRSRLRTFGTPPAVEAHVLLDDQSGEQIDDCLNSKSPLALSASRDVFVIHNFKGTSIASGRLLARPPVRMDSTLGSSLMSTGSKILWKS